jgi:hypothetical protein
MDTFILAMLTNVANDNAPGPYDPRDYENFDPSVLPHDLMWDDDAPLPVDAFMNLYA